MTRTVTVGPAEGLDITEVTARRPVWTGCAPPLAPRDCLVQLRAHGDVHACTAWLDGDGVRIRLHRPARGVARGQAAVLYDGDTVLGSATISGTSAPAPVARVPAGPGVLPGPFRRRRKGAGSAQAAGSIPGTTRCNSS